MTLAYYVRNASISKPIKIIITGILLEETIVVAVTVEKMTRGKMI